MREELKDMLSILVELCLGLGIDHKKIDFLVAENDPKPIGAQAVIDGVMLWVTSDPITPMNKVGVSAAGNWGAVSWSHNITTLCLKNIEKSALVGMVREALLVVKATQAETQVN